MGIAVAVAGVALGRAPALAQSAPAATTNTPAADAIGPRELQNFSLDGTVTRPADQPRTAAPRNSPASAQAQTPRREQPSGAAETPRAATAQTPATSAQRTAAEDAAARAGPAPRAVAPPPRAEALGRSSVTVDLPPARASAAVATADPGFASEPQSSGTLAPEHGLPLWPWLLAALALGAGGGFLFWRRQHGREAFAGGPRVDAFVAPPPAAAPPRAAPKPPQPTPAPVPGGVVSTRLRPWLDITFTPLRCVVEEREVTLEFELSLLNSGSTTALEVLLEASLFNAGPTQDQDIGTFFENPVGQGQRIAALQPLKSFSLRPQLTIPIEQLRVLEAGGRRLFVPLIAFNILYGWSSGKGQTSAAFMVGRDTNAEKLAPLRLDLGRRIFRGLGQHALPISVRN